MPRSAGERAPHPEQRVDLAAHHRGSVLREGSDRPVCGWQNQLDLTRDRCHQTCVRMHRCGQRGVEGDDPFRLLEQQGVAIHRGADSARHRDQRKDVPDPSPYQGVRDLLDRLEQRRAALVSPPGGRRQRRCVEPSRLRASVHAQLRRPLEGVGGDAVSAPCSRPFGGPLQQVGRLRVRADRRSREMPSAAVRIGVLGEGPMGAAALSRSRLPVGDGLE